MWLFLLLVNLPCLSLAASVQSGFDYQKSSLVVAHFIVGNTYPYTKVDWMRDITLAASKGIDAFALNVGVDFWQPARVADAFEAAKACADHGTIFNLFLSFDMTSLPCSDPSDASILRTYINTYHPHPNQFRYHGKTFLSTFSGESCYFGTGSVNDGWTAAIKTGLPPIHFVPAFFMDPSEFPSMSVMDGAFNWNAAWPMGDYDINFNPDNSYLSSLGGRSYMASVSPWFFTHYGPNSYNKNFIYRGDDWLLAERWELLIQNRRSVDLAQVISWNDYGESHYVGPIEGAQPNSQAWTNGFDHQGWLDLIAYYIKAFKTGSYPAVVEDRLFLWARLYPAQGTAPDSVGRPANWQFTEDYLWAVVFLTAPSNVTLSCGSERQTNSLPKGVSRLSLPLVTNCRVRGLISRDGVTIKDFTPAGFEFSTTPPSYNFNAFVAA